MDLNPVDYCDDLLSVACQIAGPFLEFIGLGLAAEKDDAFLDADAGIGKPAGGFQDSLKALADFFVACNGINADFRRCRGETLFSGGNWSGCVVGGGDCRGHSDAANNEQNRNAYPYTTGMMAFEAARKTTWRRWGCRLILS